MSYLFVEYPKCTTCKRAKKWLDDHEVDYEDRHIVEKNPTAEELQKWIEKSELPIKKFFNTSGILYKEMNLSQKLKTLSEEEQIELLATNGMLVKRPILVGEDFVLVGFRDEAVWKETLKVNND
ncbi:MULTISPECIES: arsenate reductase family protein [Clostridium]|uniref:Transcriptional regulator, Spx/MgsR family n=1 Tax=Clostridium saccharoperbutylacetonicum N1-4(HMT) TaxID=931276 RepID=M1MIR1_9CLOT|nr:MULTISPECIES: arsenate reductase family protein [Clostridium]AGF56213.1 transcriptional regulator, Spx/MgsR family [Clostridium saccharoperbutylacetonicum N1-4(HMT)]AQR94949.1 regulatory protein MgsR [Clostridium saccharoperbutylacetonicum]NRT63045.1 arsenate reductase [Clostridium saccharoperbutylacetonicum]NSB26402.1 arsenate reductase [Clostridium saccharoperbutylacetonicum]NSB30792.1 arsenate reductase [Clostridium saccharoperbutylacetonicum]